MAENTTEEHHHHPVVAVTGASGFLGSHLCQNLVEHGYEVRACVREDLPHKTDHLRAMNHQPSTGSGRLEIFVADMGAAGAYDAIFEGCSVVFHVAGNFGTDPAWREQTQIHGRPSPVEQLLVGNDDDNETPTTGFCPSYDHAVYDSYLTPMHHVLESARKSRSVRRIVYTSSGAAGGIVRAPERHDDQDLEEAIRNNAYGRAKLDCERQLYAFGQESQDQHRAAAYRDEGEEPPVIVCASSCPCIVLGPLLAAPLHDSVYQHRLADMLAGRYVLDQEWDVADVRDVAETQRRIAEWPGLVNGTRFWNGWEPLWPVPEILAYCQKEFPNEPLLEIPHRLWKEEPFMVDEDHALLRFGAERPGDDNDRSRGEGAPMEDGDAAAEARSELSATDDETSLGGSGFGTELETEDEDYSTHTDDDSFGESEWEAKETSTWSDPVRVLGLVPRLPRTTVRDTVRSLLDHGMVGRSLTQEELCNYYTVAEMDGCEEEMDYLVGELNKTSFGKS